MRKTNLFVITLILLSVFMFAGCTDASTDASTETIDTDGDGLSDFDEINIFHTSELLADTDGDQISDSKEVLIGGGKAALIANIPYIEISMVGDVSIDLSGAIKTNCAVSTTSASITTKNTTFARSGERSASNIKGYEKSATASASVSFPFSASVSASGTVSASGSTATGNTVGWQAGGAQSAQKQYQEDKTCFDESVTDGGDITVGFKITNHGDIPTQLTDLTVSLLQQNMDNPDDFATIRTASLDLSKTDSTIIEAGQTVGPFALTAKVGAAKAIELWKNPSGLSFSVASYSIEDVNNTDYGWINNDVNKQTAGINIDYGASKIDTDGLNVVKNYFVATNVLRNDDLSPKGITLGEVLTDVIGLPYTTKNVDVLQADGSTISRKVFASLNGVAIDYNTTQFWLLTSNSKTLDTTTYTSVEDITLKAGDFVDLTLIRDFDQDGLFDREEFIAGTDPKVADTDGDGLSDYNETKISWTNGYNSEVIYSSPLLADMDGDGLNDFEEFKAKTNPLNTDTDGDGLNDKIDKYPLVVSVKHSKWKMVSASKKHAIGVKEDGTLWVWGTNDYGVFGYSENKTIDHPEQILTYNNWSYVAAGENVSFAIDKDGKLWGWGRNHVGVFGLGNTLKISEGIFSSPKWIDVDSSKVTKVVTTGSQTMILSDNGLGDGTGSIYTTGANADGQLGLRTLEEVRKFTKVGTASDWIDIAMTLTASAAVKKDNSIYGWGSNKDLMINSIKTSKYKYLAPAKVLSAHSELTKVSMGYGNTMMINPYSTKNTKSSNNGKLMIRGSNSKGTRGSNSSSTGWADQMQIDITKPYVDGCLKRYTAIVIDKDGSLYAWGANGYGQAGHPADYNMHDDYKRVRIGTAKTWKRVFCGIDNNFALREDGELFSLGRGEYGVLGNRLISNSDSLTQVVNE